MASASSWLTGVMLLFLGGGGGIGSLESGSDMPMSRQLICLMKIQIVLLSKALKAGSTFPPLAKSTAFTTLRSIAGKASMRVASASAFGSTGLGGFGGGGGADACS